MTGSHDSKRRNRIVNAVKIKLVTFKWKFLFGLAIIELTWHYFIFAQLDVNVTIFLAIVGVVTVKPLG